MSKKSKIHAREERRKLKRSKKAAQQALYEGWRDSGKNTKSKRSILNNQRNKKSTTKHMHLVAFCGNPGCKRCASQILTGPKIDFFDMARLRS